MGLIVKWFLETNYFLWFLKRITFLLKLLQLSEANTCFEDV